ncbi:MAG: hypothetical protein ABJM86_09005 [Hyphomicrobiales bacterium]
MSEWFKNSFPAWAMTACVALLAVILSQLFDQSSKVAENGALIQQVQTGIADTETKLSKRLTAIDDRLQKIQTSMDTNALDLPAMLAHMGTLRRGDSFDAAIIGDHVWIFAGSAEVNQRLIASGLKPEPINSAITGFKTMSVQTLSAQ